MIYYHVFIGPSKHIDIVKAINGEHAIQIIEAKFGPARNFSKEYNNYRAVRA
jgi:hypothetical protein